MNIDKNFDDSRGYRRTYLIGVLAQVVAGIAKTPGKPLTLEKLDFDDYSERD